MPIYAYRCETCGFQQDVLQKMSDPRLVTCPSCGNATFQKQVTAAGFQLKGSGWYVTDFRNPAKEGSKTTKSDESAAGDAKKDATSSDGKPDGAATSPAPAPAAASTSGDQAASAPPPKASPPPASGTD